MSGICGIFETGRPFGPMALGAMLQALALPGDTGQRAHAGLDVALGVSGPWEGQAIGTVGDVIVALDSDFIGRNSAETNRDTVQHTAPAELVAQLYQRYGLDFLDRLHGAFSIALWDGSAKRLILAIDRMGIRSLYWRQESSRILFASRIAAIRAAQDSSQEPDLRALLQYLLFSAVPAPLSIDRGTKKLQPGTMLLCESGRLQVHRYWDLEYPEEKGRTEDDWARDVREAMRAAVHDHAEGCASQSTGAFLSGGTDSSSVVAFLSEKYSPAQSFSIAFKEAGFSEIEFARTTARRFETRHHEKWLAPHDAWDALEKLISYYDEPFANSSTFGSYYCAKLAQENGVDTLLAGDGGDELFGGNERYSADKRFALYHSLPKWLRQKVLEPLVARLPDGESKMSLPRRYVRRASIPNPRRILSYGFFLSNAAEEVFSSGFLEQLGTGDWLSIPEEHFRRARASSELNRILYLDVKMTLADNDLRKVSGTAEIAGVRVRYPLLDHRLAELSGRVPAALKLKGFEKRYIFKQAMKGILPEKVLYKKKHGFGVPVCQWLLGDPRMNELMQDVLHDPRTRQRGYFQPDFFEKLEKLHRLQPNFYGEIVWYVLALELWHRRHLERSREVVHAL